MLPRSRNVCFTPFHSNVYIAASLFLFLPILYRLPFTFPRRWTRSIRRSSIIEIFACFLRQINGHGIVEKLTPNAYQRSSPSPFHPTWVANRLIRSKRNGQAEDETIVRRHARHRKRHRCKNRSSCFRNAYVAGLSLLRDNDTTSVDEASKETKDDRDENAVLEITEEPSDRLGVRKSVQVIIDNSRGSDKLCYVSFPSV